MNILDAFKKIKVLLSSVKLSQVQLADGSLIQYTGDDIADNDIVYLIDPAGNLSVLPDGDYLTKDGVKFTIDGGTVTNVINASVQSDSDDDKPILQAQSSDIPSEKEEIKENKKITMATKNDATEKEATPIVDATDASDISTDDSGIDTKLAPILAAIAQIQEVLQGCQLMSKETNDSVTKLASEVLALSKQPSAQPIEKEINPYRPAPKELKESKAWKVMVGEDKA